MSASPSSSIFRKDYTPPNYLIEQVELRFELGEAATAVASRMQLRLNTACSGGALVLAEIGRAHV